MESGRNRQQSAPDSKVKGEFEGKQIGAQQGKTHCVCNRIYVVVSTPNNVDSFILRLFLQKDDDDNDKHKVEMQEEVNRLMIQLPNCLSIHSSRPFRLQSKASRGERAGGGG